MEKKKNSKKFLLMVSIIIIILIISVITIILLNKKDLKTNKNVQVNAPQLVEGMTPIKWKDSKWVETTTDDKDWYNYANKKWANVKLADGSTFVWIPRYAYKISKGYHENLTNGGEVDIKFLSGTTNNTFENEKIDISNTNSKDNYVISPAFKFGDENLEGIWVAKYEASREDSTSTETGKSQILSFKNNKLSVLDYDLNQILYYCRNLEKQNNFGWKAQNGNILNTGDILEDDNNFDTHLIKNTEWGSVAYLSQSIYGINNKITANTSQISGNGGNSSTTTGNETGIYDMAGQNAEYVSSYFESTTSNYALEKYTNMVKFSDKYKDRYTAYTSDNFGEAIYEISSKQSLKNGWYETESSFVNSSYPFFVRGGTLDKGNIFNFSKFSGEKGYYSFRPAIVISTDVLSEEENKEKSESLRKENMQKTKSDSLNTLLNSLNNNYTKGYLDEMDLFTNTQTITDINFTKLREYYENFKTDYENFKNNISQYEELQSEMAEIIQTTDEFLNEFDKATTQNNDVNTIIQSFENSSNKWTGSYKLVYKMLYGKELDI